jgi:hypothetical protein
MIRMDFPQKRNQARQKMATLPELKIKELGAELFFELQKRFPSLVDAMEVNLPQARIQSVRVEPRQRAMQNSNARNRVIQSSIDNTRSEQRADRLKSYRRSVAIEAEKQELKDQGSSNSFDRDGPKAPPKAIITTSYNEGRRPESPRDDRRARVDSPRGVDREGGRRGYARPRSMSAPENEGRNIQVMPESPKPFDRDVSANEKSESARPERDDRREPPRPRSFIAPENVVVEQPALPSPPRSNQSPRPSVDNDRRSPNRNEARLMSAVANSESRRPQRSENRSRSVSRVRATDERPQERSESVENRYEEKIQKLTSDYEYKITMLEKKLKDTYELEQDLEIQLESFNALKVEKLDLEKEFDLQLKNVDALNAKNNNFMQEKLVLLDELKSMENSLKEYEQSMGSLKQKYKVLKVELKRMDVERNDLEKVKFVNFC